MTKLYDTIIVGAGAAGLTAAVYTCRKKMKTLIISVDVGGQTLLTNHIENYPGYTDLSGPKLMQIFMEQAVSFGSETVTGKVSTVKKEKDSFKVTLTNGDSYTGRTLILAYGKVPRELGIPGESRFIGKGVSTCATCDAPIYKKKTVAVVGGGNSALEAALLASEFSTRVYLVHRRDEFRGDPITVDKLKGKKNIEFMLGHMPVEVKGERFVSGLVIKDLKSDKTRELAVHGVFVEIGYIVDTSFVKAFVETNEANEIVVNDYCETKTPGIFACGDVTNIPYKQTVISAGHGATAGMTAYNYLQKLSGKPAIKIDWGV